MAEQNLKWLQLMPKEEVEAVVKRIDEGTYKPWTDLVSDEELKGIMDTYKGITDPEEKQKFLENLEQDKAYLQTTGSMKIPSFRRTNEVHPAMTGDLTEPGGIQRELKGTMARWVAKARMDDPKAVKSAFKKDFPNLDVNIQDEGVFVRQKGDKKWYPIDPSHSIFPLAQHGREAFRDAGDFLVETLTGAAEARAGKEAITPSARSRKMLDVLEAGASKIAPRVPGGRVAQRATMAASRAMRDPTFMPRTKAGVGAAGAALTVGPLLRHVPTAFGYGEYKPSKAFMIGEGLLSGTLPAIFSGTPVTKKGMAQYLEEQTHKNLMRFFPDTAVTTNRRYHQQILERAMNKQKSVLSQLYDVGTEEVPAIFGALGRREPEAFKIFAKEGPEFMEKLRTEFGGDIHKYTHDLGERIMDFTKKRRQVVGDTLGGIRKGPYGNLKLNIDELKNVIDSEIIGIEAEARNLLKGTAKSQEAFQQEMLKLRSDMFDRVRKILRVKDGRIVGDIKEIREMGGEIAIKYFDDVKKPMKDFFDKFAKMKEPSIDDVNKYRMVSKLYHKLEDMTADTLSRANKEVGAAYRAAKDEYVEGLELDQYLKKIFPKDKDNRFIFNEKTFDVFAQSREDGIDYFKNIIAKMDDHREALPKSLHVDKDFMNQYGLTRQQPGFVDEMDRIWSYLEVGPGRTRRAAQVGYTPQTLRHALQMTGATVTPAQAGLVGALGQRIARPPTIVKTIRTGRKLKSLPAWLHAGVPMKGLEKIPHDIRRGITMESTWKQMLRPTYQQTVTPTAVDIYQATKESLMGQERRD